MFVEPTSPLWHQSALSTPRAAVYLHIGFTRAAARSGGIGAALVDRTMAWAREAGYDCCTAHWVTASRAAAFWQRQGFRPVTHWLHRAVDERATWADSRA
jgi:GNAT superfamily N-acetyltransferase